MTVLEAIEKGYKPIEEKKAAGYVSRRQTTGQYLEQDLQYAKNKKMYYAVKPCNYSNNFHIRVYYIKED